MEKPRLADALASRPEFLKFVETLAEAQARTDLRDIVSLTEELGEVSEARKRGRLASRKDRRRP
ncbi:MAG: hypothetical protein CFE29_08525 [Bradyrhizobiaceae bacterium PARB1]|jgi:hypothetical protein|nr:MAG: hypothetical protein CFE29_08525 [Bradyrhizobiaceae bacterium PARB1]